MQGKQQVTDMVERVARAIYEGPDSDIYLTPWQEMREKDRDHYIGLARAAIEAMREPTKAMVVAMDEHAGTIAPQYAYEAAIAAALATS